MARASQNSKRVSVRRTQAERREESDRRLMKAATELIAKRGASGTALADVGLAAGYSRGLATDRYASKQGLLEALLDSMDTWFQSQLDRALVGKRGLAALQARIDTHVDGARRSPLAMSAIYSIYIESFFAMPELKPRLAALTERWRKGFITHLREGQAEGEIRADIDCDQYATILLGAIRGLMIEYLIGERSTDLRAVDAALAELVKEMICSKLGTPLRRDTGARIRVKK